MMREDEEVEMRQLPAWFQGLMAETFFVACGIHRNYKKNEKNIFCLHCCQSFCPHCLPSHYPQHSLLQVRRYVYQDVIRLDELEKIIDCSFIQPYAINGAKVIFLNPRAQTQSRSNCNKLLQGQGQGQGQGGGSRNTCFTCDRILQDPFNFCSLSCKVYHYIYRGEDLSSLLYNKLDECDFGFEGLRVDGSKSDLGMEEGESTPPSSILEDPLECGGSNYGRGAGLEESAAIMRRNNNSEKRGGERSFLNGIVLPLGSRRKGNPQRSPLS